MSSFKPNPRFVEELRHSAGVRAYLRARAEAGAEATRAAAPDRTGHYKDSIKVEDTATGARVLSTDAAASLIEWGSVNNPAYGPLKKGAELSGAHYVDTGRP
jgi:hypothetical protein